VTDLIEPGASLREYSDVEYVFEPHDNSLPAAKDYIRSVWDRRQFMTANAKAELKGPYAGTILGEAWRIIDPLFQALIYWFLFTAIRGNGGTEWFLMVVSDVFLFTFSMNALGQGGRAIQRSRGLVLNSAFPLATLPLSTMYQGLVQIVPMMGVYAIFHVVFGGPIGPGLAMVPFLFLLQVGMSVGLMLIFATLTVYIRDMSALLDYVLRILMFVTPVLYPASQLTKAPAIIRPILFLNPFFPLFSAYQAAFGGGVPTFGQIALCLVWAVALPIIGFRFFVSRERGFALRL
jgi:teichoic acid transport system permease protein